MTKYTTALNGFGVDIFASMPVTDIKQSTAWYEKLLGCKPSFLPNETEAVWQISEHQWLYIIVDVKKAGGAINTIMGTDLDKLIDEIAERGMKFDDEERPAPGVRKVMFYDPDGNELGLGSVASS